MTWVGPWASLDGYGKLAHNGTILADREPPQRVAIPSELYW